MLNSELCHVEVCVKVVFVYLGYYQHCQLSVQQLHMTDCLRIDTTHKCNTSITCLHFFTLTKATDATGAAVNASVISTDTWHRGS